MAAMTTVLTEFSDNGNSRTFTLPGHTVQAPQIVIQRRKVPSGNATTAEDTLSVLTASFDSDSAILPSKNSISAIVKRPIDGQAAELTAILATFRDLVNSDEFTNMITTQEFVL
jgi:hypothetical protein